MIKTISSFFDNYLKPDETRPEQSRVDTLHLASAALMIELSRADHEISEEETRTLMEILKKKFGLKQEDLEELFTLAEHEAHEATSIYQFTSLINEAYDYPSKISLIKDMWEVAYADGRLDRYEDHLIRKVADLLYVSHRDFIKTKLAVRSGMDPA